MQTTTFQTDKNGFYGEFGGAFVPEMLYPNVKELQDNYLNIINEASFQAEFRGLLKDCLLYTSDAADE